jgi:hypothetical protein
MLALAPLNIKNKSQTNANRSYVTKNDEATSETERTGFNMPLLRQFFDVLEEKGLATSTSASNENSNAQQRLSSEFNSESVQGELLPLGKPSTVLTKGHHDGGNYSPSSVLMRTQRYLQISSPTEIEF